jgi:hypothetical protein
VRLIRLIQSSGPSPIHDIEPQPGRVVKKEELKKMPFQSTTLFHAPSEIKGFRSHHRHGSRPMAFPVSKMVTKIQIERSGISNDNGDPACAQQITIYTDSIGTNTGAAIGRLPTIPDQSR